MEASGGDGDGGVDGRTLKTVFSKLVDGLKATDIIDELFEKDLLILDEYTGILKACSQSSTKENSRNVNRRVLTAILCRPPGFVAKLVAILRKKDRSLANALENALAEVSGQRQPDPAPSQQFTQDVQPSSSGVMAGPMSKWNVDALVALKGKLKLNVKMIALANVLETPAGGFMNSAEAQSVRAKCGDAQQIEEVIDILRGKGDKEFATFCQMLHKSNYQVWARELEVEAEMFKTSDALPGTDPAPLRGNPQAVMSTSAPAPGPSKEGGVPCQQSTNSTPHPFSSTLNSMCWPEFPALQDEFSTLVSKLSETVHKLEQPQFDSLLAYLRERLRPMVDGCLPTEASPNIPDDPTPAELVRHLQKCHYWNYLNTDLLEDIIKHVSREGSPLASLMAKYKENFRNKMTQTLEECRRNSWPSKVTFLEEEVARLKQQLKKSEVDRQELSAELRECRKIKVEPGVCTTKPVPPKKQRLKDGGEEEEKPERKKVKTETADTVEVKLESHPQEEKEGDGGWYEPPTPSIIYERGPQTPSVFPPPSPYSSTGQTEMAETVEMELESHPQEEKKREERLYEPPPPSIIYERGPQTPSMFPPPSPYTSSEHSLELAAPTFLHPESLEMELPREEQAWVPPQVGAFPPHVSSGARPPVPQPYSFQQPVQMGPPGSQATQVGVFPPHVSSAARLPVTQHSSLQPVVPQVPPQVGVSSPYVFRGAIPPHHQLSSIAQPVQTTPLGWQQTQVGVFPFHVSSGARPPVTQASPLLQPVPTQVGVSSPYVFRGAIPPYPQLSSLAQPVQRTPLGSQQTQIFQTGPLLHGSSNMQSVKLPDLPIPTSDASAVMINDHIYVCGGLCGGVDLARQVQVYDVNHNVWGTLPHSPQYHSQGVAINRKLVLIGGHEAASKRVTNLVSTWTGQGWQQDLPPMPTKRIDHSATTYHTFVVVAGGKAENEQTLLSSIDILNITTRQWWTPTSLQLPRPMYGMQCVVSSAHLCVASAYISYDVDGTGTTVTDMWQMPVTALEKMLIPGHDDTPHQWTRVAPTPYYNSAVLQDTAHIVAVGGDNSLDEPTPGIFVYNPDRDVWSKVGQLGVPRASCAVVSLSRTSFIVCGGCTDTMDPDNTLLSSVEIVHV